MEAGNPTANVETGATRGLPGWLLAVVPLILILGAIGAFVALDGPGLGERRGPPVEELAFERTKLRPGTIELTVRNDGPDPVTVAQVIVNDAFASFTGAEEPIDRLKTETITVQQPWIEGEAYEVALLTSAGTTIAHEIPAAVETPSADVGLLRPHGAARASTSASSRSRWGCCGCRGSGGSRRRGCASSWRSPSGCSASSRSTRRSKASRSPAEGSQAFGGQALVFIGAVVAFLALTGVSAWLRDRRRAAADKGASAGSLATAHRRRDRPAQPRRGPRDRHRLHDRRARARRVPRRRLRAAQHDRGPRDRRADRPRQAVARTARRCSASSPARPPCSARGSARRRSTRRSRRSSSAPGRRDRAGHRPARAVAARRAGPHAAPARRRRPARRPRAHVRHRPARESPADPRTLGSPLITDQRRSARTYRRNH